jgi:hypothetical protein
VDVDGKRVTLSCFSLGGDPQGRANDEFIVEAVNSHDKLLSDRKTLLDALKEVARWNDEEEWTWESGAIPETLAGRIGAAIDQAEREG